MRRLPRPPAFAVAVTICLLALTSAAALATSRAIDRREDNLLEERARQAAGTVDRRTDDYVEKLTSTRGLFSSTPDGIPAPREYDSFLRSQELSRRIPELQSVTFVQEVPHAERETVLRRLRRETAASGLPYPEIRGIDPPGRRERYGVITYVYPVARNRPAVGIDLLVDPIRRGAIERARTTAGPVSPAPVRLVQDPDELSVVLYLPIYAGPDQSPRPAERARRFVGVIGTGIRLSDLTRGLAVEPGDDVRLYDLGYAGGRTLRRLIHSTRPDADVTDRSDDLPLQTASRRWILTYASAQPLVNDIERAVPLLIGGLGALVSLLAGAVVATATSGRRQALAELEASRNELARSNEELERFAFLASHDLQQPLRTVSGFLELLVRQQGDRLDERGHQYVDMALRGTKQMSSLITDLLAYSRVARDDRPLEPVALDEAWDAAVGQLQAMIAEADAEVSRGALPVVDGDPVQMTQLFANLISNAVRYRGEEAPTVRAEARRANGEWEVAVEDNGIGIEPSDQERIFEMFRRLHSDDEIEGTGVGLALVKRIAERSGGDVAVESRPGSGSRFVVRLPAKEAGDGR
jgi:signal transduction histidine kinase